MTEFHGVIMTHSANGYEAPEGSVIPCLASLLVLYAEVTRYESDLQRTMYCVDTRNFQNVFQFSYKFKFVLN